MRARVLLYRESAKEFIGTKASVGSFLLVLKWGCIFISSCIVQRGFTKEGIECWEGLFIL